MPRWVANPHQLCFELVTRGMQRLSGKTNSSTHIADRKNSLARLTHMGPEVCIELPGPLGFAELNKLAAHAHSRCSDSGGS